MAAKNKTDLLEINQKEFLKLETLILSIRRDQALLKDEDSTSIKDVVAHRAHWIDLFLGWYPPRSSAIRPSCWNEMSQAAEC